MRIILFLFCIIIGGACSIKHNSEIPIIKFIQQENSKIDSLNCIFIPLELNDSCILSGIEDIQIVNDHIYLIDSKNKGLYVFTNTGKFVTQIGSYGNGPGEYIMPSRFHIQEAENIITIIDFRCSKILDYDLRDYHFLASHNASPLYDCAWLFNGDITWFDMTGYETDKRELYHIKNTNKKQTKTNYYYPTKLTTGYSIGLGKRFHTFDKEVFLSIQFSPTVYKILPNGVESAYNLFFEDLQFPSEEWLLSHLENDNNYTQELLQTEYISAYNLNETSNYIAATLYANGRNTYLGFYNKQTKCSILCLGSDFIEKFELYGMGHIIGTADDYFITTITPSMLKQHSIQRKDLKQIAQNCSEENNPILCLFKINTLSNK